MSQLTGVRACVFDAYGTIFDFASAAARCSGVPEHQRADLASIWRDKQLQYTWLRTLQGRYADFWQITGDALDFALDSLDLRDSALRGRLMNLYLTVTAFPEVSGVLRSLKHSGFITAILSNGSPAMLESAVAAAGLTDLFDEVLSADAVGAFKTHPESLSICAGSTRGSGLGRIVSILQCLGCTRRRGFWHARGVVQPLCSAQRAPAGIAAS